jgi:hypothetical protein
MDPSIKILVFTQINAGTHPKKVRDGLVDGWRISQEQASSHVIQVCRESGMAPTKLAEIERQLLHVNHTPAREAGTIRFKCPKCGKALVVPLQNAGKCGKCPACNNVISSPASNVQPTPKQPQPVSQPYYGLSFENPVLCGGGPPGEQTYLQKLRCPAGQAVQFTRRGSQIATNLEFLRAEGVRWFPGRQAIAMGITPQSIEPLPLDVYEVECLCGQHRLEVIMDMYHRGSDNGTKGVEAAGWTHGGW